MSLSDIVTLNRRPLPSPIRRRLAYRRLLRQYLKPAGYLRRLFIRESRRRWSVVSQYHFLNFRSPLDRRPHGPLNRRFQQAVARLRKIPEQWSYLSNGREFRSAFRSLLLQASPRTVVCRRDDESLVAVAQVRRRVQYWKKLYKILNYYIFLCESKKKNHRLVQLYVSLESFFRHLSELAHQRKKLESLRARRLSKFARHLKKLQSLRPRRLSKFARQRKKLQPLRPRRLSKFARHLKKLQSLRARILSKHQLLRKKWEFLRASILRFPLRRQLQRKKLELLRTRIFLQRQLLRKKMESVHARIFLQRQLQRKRLAASCASVLLRRRRQLKNMVQLKKLVHLKKLQSLRPRRLRFPYSRHHRRKLSKRRFRPLFRPSAARRFSRYLRRRRAKDLYYAKKRLRYYFHNVKKIWPRISLRARWFRSLSRRRSRRALRLQRRLYRRFRSSPKGWLLLVFHRFRRLLRNRFHRRHRVLSSKKPVLLSGFVNYNLHWYNRNKLQTSTAKGFARLHKGYARGFFFDYPGRYEKFRWPERLYKVYAIDPLSVWKKLVARSFLFGRHFAFVHGDQHTLTEYQCFTMQLLYSVHTDFYGLPGWLPLEKAPSFLFPRKAIASFYLYWQHPITLHDQYLSKEGYYDRRVIYTPWSRWLPKYFIGRRLPSLLRTSLLWDFVDREYRFWHLWARIWEARIWFPLWWMSVKHPHWFLDYHLERLVIALAFLPKTVRRRFTSHWRRLAGCYARLWTAKLRRRWKIRRRRRRRTRTLQQKLDLYTLQGFGRQRSWFIRQKHYYRRMMGPLRWSRGYSDRYRLFILGRLYRRLWLRDRDSFPSSRLPALFAPALILTTDTRLCWRRILFRRRINFLDRRGGAKPLWGRIRRIIRRRRVRVNPHRPSMSMFFWKLLALWLLLYYKRVTTTVPMLSHYYWLVQETFAVPTTAVDRWFLTGGFLQPAFRCTPYRLACFQWVERKAQKTKRRRHRFRFWLHKFFLRRRWFHSDRGYRRPKIPGYYRRFNYIRSLPLSSFRLFWPQSANFTRPRRWYSRYGSKARSGFHKRRRKVAPLSMLSMESKKFTAVHSRSDLSGGRPYSHGRSKQDRSNMGILFLVTRKNLAY